MYGRSRLWEFSRYIYNVWFPVLSARSWTCQSQWLCFSILDQSVQYVQRRAVVRLETLPTGGTSKGISCAVSELTWSTSSSTVLIGLGISLVIEAVRTQLLGPNLIYNDILSGCPLELTSLVPRSFVQDTYKRAVQFFMRTIEPRLKEGRNVMMVAHGNVLRCIISQLSGLTAQEMLALQVSSLHCYIVCFVFCLQLLHAWLAANYSFGWFGPHADSYSHAVCLRVWWALFCGVLCDASSWSYNQ